MTKRELKRELTIATADLYLVQAMLERAICADVPPDVKCVIELDAIAKLLQSILAKIDTLEPDLPHERE
jgi:hypothetical protein